MNGKHGYQKPSLLPLTVKRLLLTGFEPFGGSDVNVSQDLVHAIASVMLLGDPWKEVRHTSSAEVEVEIEGVVLPVDKEGSLATARRLLSGESWDGIVHLGVCGTCTTPRLELRAQDELEMRIPDNSGRQVSSESLSGSGDLWSTAPIKTWMQDWDIDATPSVDAGRFLCNETLYRTLEAIQSSPIPTLFIHFPPRDKYPFEQSLALVTDVLARLVHKPVLKVAGALFTHEHQFLLARRAPHELHSGTWEFPGGKLEPSESSVEAIVREIHEEFGWNIQSLPSIGTWYHELDHVTIALDVLPCTFIDMLPLLDDRSLWTSHDRVEWHTAMSCSELPFTGSDRDVVHALVKSGLLD